MEGKLPDDDDRDNQPDVKPSAPSKLSIVIDKTVTFTQLGLCAPLAEACKAMGYVHPTMIQKEALPYALKGRDIIGLAQTGSGKTAAFALPILQDLLDKQQKLFALVMSPTRELAVQIARQFEALGSIIGVQVAVVVGGMDTMQQAIMLAKRPHIIVGTPGRIVYHLENTKGFSLRSLQYLVLDEADRLLNLDFEKEINTILKVIPKERHTYLFSATMTTKVAKLQRASLRDPVKLEVSAKYTTPSTLLQQFLFIPAKLKDCYLVYILNELAGNTILVFASTCQSAMRSTAILRNLGFAAVPLHGQMTQPKRLAALNKFASGERKILVATDVASRGLDIPSVDVVINLDTPHNPKDYVHRVGRTARAGHSGRALSIVTQYDVEMFQRIEALIGQKMEEYKRDDEAVMLLVERVNEAQRLAAIQLREAGQSRKGDRDEGGDADDGDAEESAPRVHNKGGGGGGGGHKKSTQHKKKFKRS